MFVFYDVWNCVKFCILKLDVHYNYLYYQLKKKVELDMYLPNSSEYSVNKYFNAFSFSPLLANLQPSI